MAAQPEMCVIVLSHGGGRPTAAAIESLLAQQEELEIVLSHSGGGDTPGLIGERFRGVGVVTVPELRSPGAARNAGLAATAAPYVAFLADDCTALPGWAAGRLRRHRAGAAAVASAMAAPSRIPELAAHLLQHAYRMPHVAASGRLRFGVSYTREVLERHGPFPEDLRGEEDVVLNGRLIDAGVPIEWAPDVVIAHRYASSARELLADQHRRGRLRYQVRGAGRPRPVLAARALLDGPAGLRHAARRGSGVPARRLALTAPLVLAGSLATAAGIATARG